MTKSHFRFSSRANGKAVPLCSVQLPTCKLKQILNAIFKYHGIYLTYQMAICLTKMPLLPLRYFSYKCWLSLIKIPDRTWFISCYLNSETLSTATPEQPFILKTESPPHSILLFCAKNNQLCTTPHMQALAYYSRW